MLVIDYFIFIVSILIVVAILLQESTEDAADALTGEKSDLFKNRKLRGSELFLTRATSVLVVVFIIMVVISNYWTRF